MSCGHLRMYAAVRAVGYDDAVIGHVVFHAMEWLDWVQMLVCRLRALLPATQRGNIGWMLI